MTETPQPDLLPPLTIIQFGERENAHGEHPVMHTKKKLLQSDDLQFRSAVGNEHESANEPFSPVYFSEEKITRVGAYFR